MNRKLPIHNKLSDQLNIYQENIKLMKRLQDVKPGIKIPSPKKYSHLGNNKKKQQMFEDQCTEIERENRILIEKLTKIIKNKSSSSTS